MWSTGTSHSRDTDFFCELFEGDIKLTAWRWAGFVYGRSGEDLLLIIPYWAIVTALTAPAAWLLLSSRTKPTR